MSKEKTAFLKYADLLWDKSVTIVGGREIDEEERCKVESYDLIVRINNHWERNGPNNNTGRYPRTNILYWCGAPFFKAPLNELRRAGFRFACMHSGGRSHMLASWMKELGIPYITYDHEKLTCKAGAHKVLEPKDKWFETWKRKYDLHPLTGVIAIRHISLFPVRELYVTGMDFYGVKKYEEKWGGHVIGPHKDYLRDLAQLDDRVKYSDILKGALSYE